MTENQGGAQNKLGELFVEFGSKGLGDLSKDLGVLTDKFSLATKGAKMFAQPIIKATKEVGKNALEVSKMSSTLGLSKQQYQNVQNYFKSKGFSDTLLGDLDNLRQMVYEAKHGYMEPNSGFLLALNEIGSNINNYSGTYEGMLELMSDVLKALENSSEERKLSVLSHLGASGEWVDFSNRGSFEDLKNARYISDKTIEATTKFDEAVKDFSNAVETLKNKTIGNIIPKALTQPIKESSQIIDEVNNKKTEGVVKAGIAGGGSIGGAIIGAKTGSIIGATIGSVVPGVGTAVGGAVGGILGLFGGGYGGWRAGLGINKAIYNDSTSQKQNNPFNTKLDGAENWGPMPLNEVSIKDAPDLYVEPSLSEDNSYTVGSLPLGAMESNIMINNYNEIQSNDPKGVQREIIEINANDIKNGANQVFQATHMGER